MTYFLKIKENKQDLTLKVPNDNQDGNNANNFHGEIDPYKDIVITISISNKNGESYEKGSGCHAMILYRDKQNYKNNTMVDANGSYGYKWGRTQNSPHLGHSEQVPLLLVRYVHYFDKQIQETLHIYILLSSTANILKLKKAMEGAEFRLPFVSCAATASAVMKASGLFENFEQTNFPKNIKKYLDKYSGSNFNISHSTYNFEKPEQREFGDY